MQLVDKKKNSSKPTNSLDFKFTFGIHFKLFVKSFLARVAKLVDALPSGGSVRKDVLVRIQSRALI